VRADDAKGERYFRLSSGNKIPDSRKE
jgi:hypothetical protein